MKSILIKTIKFYQKYFSPQSGRFNFIYFSPIFSLNPTVHSGCRFNPRCSDYALMVINQHGVSKGLKLLAVRLVKCF